MMTITEKEIINILVDHVEVKRQSVGITIGIVDKQGQRTFAHGALANNDLRPVASDTVFEIGSITKVFTSLLLAELVHQGALRLEDPVEKFLRCVEPPIRNGRSIRLIDLSTHTSGLPRIPTNYRPRDLSNPYAEFTLEKLREFFASFSLDRDIGVQFEYSNLGGGLLGLALAERFNTSYDLLLKQVVLEPLGLANTGVVITSSMRDRLAPGHSRDLRQTSAWEFGVLAGAGALHSNLNDMLQFISANLGYSESRLHAPMSSMLSITRPTGRGNLRVGLGWLIGNYSGRTVVWHNGATGGYRCFAGFARETGVGVVILSNTCTEVNLDDIGLQILTESQL